MVSRLRKEKKIHKLYTNLKKPLTRGVDLSIIRVQERMDDLKFKSEREKFLRVIFNNRI